MGGSAVFFQAAGVSALMDPCVMPSIMLWLFISLADVSGIFVTVISTTSTSTLSGGGSGTSTTTTTITASNGIALMFAFMCIATTSEHLVSATGTVKQGFSGTLGRPSTWMSLGKARGLFDMSVTPFVEAGGGSFDPEILKTSRAVSCYSGVRGVLNNLPTASKIRAQLLTSGAGFCFSVAYMAACAIKYGRLAEKKAAGSTRAASVPQKGLRLSRRLFKEMRMSQSFNGIASCCPELGLLEYQTSGKSSPSLLSLAMNKPQRQSIEASVARGLGAGSKLNPLIAKSQEQSSTSELGFTFNVLGKALTGHDYTDTLSWSIALSYVIMCVLFYLDSDPQGTSSDGLLQRNKEGLPLGYLSCSIGQRRMSYDMYLGVKNFGRIMYQAGGITVVKVGTAMFTQACHFAGGGGPSPAAQRGPEGGPGSGRPSGSAGSAPTSAGTGMSDEQKKKMEEGEREKSQAEEKLNELLNKFREEESKKKAVRVASAIFGLLPMVSYKVTHLVWLY